MPLPSRLLPGRLGVVWTFGGPGPGEPGAIRLSKSPGRRATVVVHDERIAGEACGEGFTAATPSLGWSMTKTVHAALVGMAIKDGKLSLDQQGLFPQRAGDSRADISVADLMAMASGLRFNEDQGLVTDPARLELLERDAAAFARAQALDAAPGTKFHYASGSSVLLARIWQNAIGASALSYPSERLVKPLGMTSAVLEVDPSGTFLAEAFLYANAHDWARLGEFLRRGGVWKANSFCHRDSSMTGARRCRCPTRATARSMVADRFGWQRARDSTCRRTHSWCKAIFAW